MEDDGNLNKENGRVPHYHQEKSQTFFAIKPDKEDKEENVHLKNLQNHLRISRKTSTLMLQSFQISELIVQC